MLKKFLKSILLLGSASVLVPYSLSVLTSLLYGWPKRKSRLWKSLDPHKVCAINYTLLQMVYTRMKYTKLWMNWTLFYRSADHHIVRKNLVFGRHEKTLDLYLPPGADHTVPHPVVVFVYGGSWSHGDKNMYGMLCHQLATKLNACVCCPNYSTYPMGFVDDMIQDVVDCIGWINNSIEVYGGDKNRIMLIGHSAGAHLCAMAVLELLHEQLMLGEPTTAHIDFQTNIRFDDTHFESPVVEPRNRTDTLDESSGSSGSFTVLNENTEKNTQQNSNIATSSFEMLPGTAGDTSISEVITEKEKEKLEESTWTEIGNGDVKDSAEEKALEASKKTDEKYKTDQDIDESEDDDDSVVTVKHKLESQPSLLELGKSVKSVIGLAGVYHIGDHLVHEASRGIDDVSCMERAMYGEECFSRFSPTHVVRTLPVGISLPHMELLHGTKDYVVPTASTTKFAEALTERCRNVGIRIIQECDHYELCLDLMDPNRKFYEPVMEIILQVANRTLN